MMPGEVVSIERQRPRLMLRLNYRKSIPYPFEVVLGQYFDYEHIEFVHPDSLGEYRLVEQDGNTIVYEHIWPRRWGPLGVRRSRSLVRHDFLPSDEMWFTFTEGRHRGTKVHTRLEKQGGITLVDETYHIPYLPDWRWLGRIIRPAVLKAVNHVWDEDLEVEVCYGGWPGVPSNPEKTGAS